MGRPLAGSVGSRNRCGWFPSTVAREWAGKLNHTMHQCQESTLTSIQTAQVLRVRRPTGQRRGARAAALRSDLGGWLARHPLRGWHMGNALRPLLLGCHLQRCAGACCPCHNARADKQLAKTQLDPPPPPRTMIAEVPGVFQTAFQSAPLDFGTDAFFPARAAAIESRLNDVAIGGAGEGSWHVQRAKPHHTIHVFARQPTGTRTRSTSTGALISATWERHHGARCRGVRWDLLPLSELLDIAECIGGVGLSVVFRLMAEDHAGSSGEERRQCACCVEEREHGCMPAHASPLSPSHLQAACRTSCYGAQRHTRRRACWRSRAPPTGCPSSSERGLHAWQQPACKSRSARSWSHRPNIRRRFSFGC